jgi:TRAP transporter 4TM/12TM fusion protein
MRSLKGWWNLPILIVGVVAGVFHYYTSGFGTPSPRILRGIHLFLLLPMVYLLFPATRKSPKNRPSLPDIATAVFCAVASMYTVVNADRLNMRFLGFHEVRLEEVFLGGLLALAVIEACRRAMSKWMAATISLVLIYLMTCQYWPGMFHFKAFSLSRAVEILYLSGDEGIFGFLTGISAEILYIYILFAAVMTATGTGEFLIDFATFAAGWAKGGSAKISALSSALYGTMSGSTVANVYATGSFTIPLMKRSGFSPKESAAIEAISGTGGQIMPPIMGAGSFIMAEITGIPYFKIITLAVIPALLYYLGVFCMVHFISIKRGISAVPRQDRPSARTILRRSYYFIPFISVIALLAYGYSPAKAAFHSIWIAILLSFLSRRTWLTPRKFLDATSGAMVNAALIAAILAGSGMIVGTLTRTGVALSFGSMFLQASMGNLVLAMILVFLVVSVVGTGIPTTPSYIISVTVGAHAMTELGVPLIAAHLFVFYYAVLADLTPPDAVTAFAAANLSGSEPMGTGFEAFRLGIAGFLVPFAFVYQPALLLAGSTLSIALSLAVTAVGVLFLSAGVIGHLAGPLSFLQRCLLLAAACLLVFPSLTRGVLGLILGLFVFYRSYHQHRTSLPKGPAPTP